MLFETGGVYFCALFANSIVGYLLLCVDYLVISFISVMLLKENVSSTYREILFLF